MGGVENGEANVIVNNLKERIQTMGNSQSNDIEEKNEAQIEATIDCQKCMEKINVKIRNPKANAVNELINLFTTAKFTKF